MQALPFKARYFGLRIAAPIAFLALLGCAQPPTPMNTPTAQTMPQDRDRVVPASTNRILARLDGLSGDSDPRLAALRTRFTQLGFTVLAMGVTPSTTSQASAKAPSHSAMIVVAVDLAKSELGQAIAQVRSLETFAYVEADQLMRQR